MRLCIFFVGMVSLISNLSAALQTITVTPSLLTQWTVTGVTPNVLNNSSQVTVPATAQVAHTYKSAILAVNFVTQPILGENSDTWPVFEMGSAALVFSRRNAEGHLILVVGDADPVDLPGSFELDADGQSTKPLVIGLSKVGTSLKLDGLGKSSEFAIAGEPSTGLVISAGSTEAWTFKSLEVTADADVLLSNADSDRLSDASKNSITTRAAKGDGSSRVAGKGSAVSATLTAVALTKEQKATADGNILEVFTPPAVRRGRLENVRAAVKAIQQP